MASRVVILDAHTINQIAAGEVVERPASVVKELVENALDAGAKRIEIQIEDAGKKRITVSDDGCGMNEEDAEKALLRHATSKIRQVDDLLRVNTLGFRGEALPSIASVSRMTLSTGEGEGRVRFVIENGKIIERTKVAGPRGTEIRVENLFEFTPARLKFLKSDQTETQAIVETVSRYVLAHPHVSFVLKVNDSESIHSSGSGDLLNAIAEVWGGELSKTLTEVDMITGNVRVRGFVSAPYMNKPTRSHQYVFVNERPIRSRTVLAAIDTAFRSLTPERRYPVAVLHLHINPAEVDINVSPTKSEVKFHKEGGVFDAVRLAIRSGLDAQGLIQSVVPSAVAVVHGGAGQGEYERFSSLAPVEKVADLFSPPPIEPEAVQRMPFLELLDDLQVLGQVANTFIVASTRKGIVILDQHVAHERVLYEYIAGYKRGGVVEAQKLLEPISIEFDRHVSDAISLRLQELKEVGFELESFGKQTYLVRAVPGCVASKDYIKILRDIADEMSDPATIRARDSREKIWVTTACRMAVKAGDSMSIPEMEKLLYELAETENPYLCPHGRPIIVTISIDELMRRFGRA